MGGDQIGQTKNIPFSMHQSYKRLLNVNPKSRLSTSHFLEQGRRNGGFFETPLVRLSEAIESLGLKSDGEREEFIRLALPETQVIAATNSLVVSSMKSPMIFPKNFSR